MEQNSIGHPARSADTSEQIGKLTDKVMPVLDFLTLYLPFDPKTKSRKENPKQPITPEVASEILPNFRMIEDQYTATPYVTASEIKNYYGLEPTDLSMMVDALSAIASRTVET